MAAPEFVPSGPKGAKYYTSPPRREGSWEAGRPGELDGPQPRGVGLGSQGPDQGFAITLANRMESKVSLQAGERWSDCRAGCVAVALKRASMFGRAPTAHDLTIAFRIWGFLDATPPHDLLDARRSLFERVDNAHHYLELRRIVDAVSADTLRSTPTQIEASYKSNWASLVDLSGADAHH